MNIQDLIQKMESERTEINSELFNSEGMERLQEVAKSYDGEYKLIWSDELFEKIKDRPERERHNVGIEKLDNATGGFSPQQLITVSAHTKHGKTAFGMFLMEKLEKLSPVMIPLEQSAEELILQRHERGFSIPKFLSPERLAARVTVEWIEQRIVEGIAKYNTRFVLIDHLGYIDDFGENNKYARENQAYRIQVVMQGLKDLAKKWNIIMVVLVHISQHDENKPPMLSDIKGSSSIAQESDMVMMLWRKNNADKRGIKVYDTKTLVSIQANRQTGKNINLALEFNDQKGTYEATKGADDWIESLESAAQRYDADDLPDSIHNTNNF